MLSKDKIAGQDFAGASKYEWLETNGLGGWAGSSITGANTRRYHGLLVAAIVPPVERMVLLSKLDETIVVHDTRTKLSTNVYGDDIVSPRGYVYLENFSKEIVPQWVYTTDTIQIKKTVCMLHGENTVVVIYDVLKADSSFTLELLPLVAARGYHSLNHEGVQIHWDADFSNGLFHNQPDGKTDLFIQVPGSSYKHSPRWFNHFQYGIEQYRGLDHTEDLLNHGIFSVEMKTGDSIGIIISTDDPTGRVAHDLLAIEKSRRELLLKEQPGNEIVRQLVFAADQFIVKRDHDLKTVIAGYHWFTDWGRDTMISLPGLCLSTGRFDDARKILSAFAKVVSKGMLPNRFQDNGEEPEYNNVDGTLWYFIAIYKYLQATGDREFVIQELLPVLKDIIDWHFEGTRYNIHVDSDGLLFAGEEGQQLTWMDARIGDWVVTPRMGKPVEIQALWYNALKIFSELLQLNDQGHDAFIVNISAGKVKDSFARLFWNEEGNCLYDNIDESGKPDATIRPNQLFAISLPFKLIEDEKSAAILRVVENHLYTPVGLRSLNDNNEQYKGIYGGDQWHRDSAYHQGTVWSWLLGPYIDAIMSQPGLDSLNKTEKAQKIIADFTYHIEEGCVGSVSEIFDGNHPHHPRGCVAQAWGVAELLRVIKDYKLYDDNSSR